MSTHEGRAHSHADSEASAAATVLEPVPVTTVPATLGDIVYFNAPAALGGPQRAAIVIELHDDGTADVRVFNGYAQSTTDFQNVAPFNTALDPAIAQPRTFAARS
jgi:hypothetical protein